MNSTTVYPTVTVIVPARNEAAHVSALLASLSAVKFPKDRLEVIVVDHQSTDGTGDLARKAGAKVIEKVGGTIASVRNAGARIAIGEVLAFVDADCTVDTEWLIHALPHFENAKVGAVGSYHQVPLSPPTWVRTVLQKQIEARPAVSEATWLPSGNMFVRRSAFRECGGFDETLGTCEDVDLCYRLSARFKVLADARIRCWHHGEPRTLWEVFRKERWRGRDNFTGAFRHGLKASEIPSLVLPIYVMVASLALAMSPVVWLFRPEALWWWVVGWLVLLGAPLLAVSTMFAVRARSFGYLVHFSVYFWAYFLARGIGPLYAWRNI